MKIIYMIPVIYGITYNYFLFLTTIHLNPVFATEREGARARTAMVAGARPHGMRDD
jgi:hypothetical protein